MLLLALKLLLIITLVSASYAGIRAAPWWPANTKHLAKLFAYLRLRPGQRVVDLGSGDGRVLFAAAEKGALAVGYEVSILPYLASQIHRFRNRLYQKQVQIHFRDFWRADIREADIVFAFLIPRVLPRLQQYLLERAKPGTIVVSHVWPIEGWEPVHVTEDPTNAFYVYHLRSSDSSSVLT